MMDFKQLLNGQMNMPAPGQDTETNDTAETVQISSLALLKVKIKKMWSVKCELSIDKLID